MDGILSLIWMDEVSANPALLALMIVLEGTKVDLMLQARVVVKRLISTRVVEYLLGRAIIQAKRIDIRHAFTRCNSGPGTKDTPAVRDDDCVADFCSNR